MILLRASRGWAREEIPQERPVWLVRFWREWLIIGDGDLDQSPQPLDAPYVPPVLRPLIHKRLRAISLRDLSRVFPLEGLLFCPAEPAPEGAGRARQNLPKRRWRRPWRRLE